MNNKFNEILPIVQISYEQISKGLEHKWSEQYLMLPTEVILNHLENKEIAQLPQLSVWHQEKEPKIHSDTKKAFCLISYSPFSQYYILIYLTNRKIFYHRHHQEYVDLQVNNHRVSSFFTSNLRIYTRVTQETILPRQIMQIKHQIFLSTQGIHQILLLSLQSPQIVKIQAGLSQAYYFSPHHFTLTAIPNKPRIKTINATNGFNINNKIDQCILDTVSSSIFSIDLFITSSASPSDADLNTDAAKIRTPRIPNIVSILPTSITADIPSYYKKYDYLTVCPTIKQTLWGVLGNRRHSYQVFPIHPSYSFFFGLFQYCDLHSGQMMGVSSLLEIHVCPHRSQVHRHTDTCSFAIDTVTGNHYKKLTLRLYLWVKYIYTLSVTVLVTQMEAKISKAKLERIRKMRAFAIIAKGDMPKRIDEHREVFVVPSQSQPQKTYTVTHNGHWECTCPDHQETGLKCKHIQSVQMWQKLEQQTEDDILTLKAEIEHPQCPECESYAVVKNGMRKTEQGKKQRYICKDCGKRFVPERNKHRKASVKLVALCMDLYFKGLSLRKISDTIEQFYDMEVSHVSVRNWINDFMGKINEYVGKYNPDVGDVWNIDEQKVKSEGAWVYAWNIMDEKTRFLIANTITEQRSILETEKIFHKAKGNAERKPSMVVTDKMRSYPHVVRGEYPEAVHVQAGIRDPINNNKLERFHGTWRERDKVMRGMENNQTTEQMLENYRTYYNFIRPHSTLGATPAEMAHINLDLGKNKWVSLIEQSMEGDE